jgi:hypothetical protein
MEDRKAFNFYKTYADIIEKLNDTQVAQFMRALISIQFLEKDINEIKFDDPMLELVFASIKYQVQQQVDGFKNKHKALKKQKKNKPKEEPTIPPCQAPSIPPTEAPMEAPCLQEKEQVKENITTFNKTKNKTTLNNTKNKTTLNNTTYTFAPNDFSNHSEQKQEQTKKVSFNFENKKWENITEEDVRLWSEAYPACNVQIALNQMASWLLANPDKRKKNYRRFITNWLTRLQDRGGNKASSSISNSTNNDDVVEKLKRKFGGLNV